MNQTIFKVVSDLESSCLSKQNKSVSVECKSVLKDIVSFIESGCFCKSNLDVFICKNFRLGASAVSKSWNDIYVGNRKSVNTIRSRISNLSSDLCVILGLDLVKLNDAVVNSDFVYMSIIKSHIEVFSLSTKLKSFDFSLVETFIPKDVKSCNYSLSECENELALLKTLERSNIISMFQDINFSKLAYLYSLIDSSLLDISYSKSGNKVRKDRNFSLNKLKFDFCLNFIKAKSLKISEKNATVPVSVEPRVEYVEVSETIPFDLAISRQASVILENCLDDYELYASEHTLDNKYVEEASDEKASLKVEVFLRNLSIGGFEEWVNRLNPYLLFEAIKRNNIRKED